MSRSSYKLFGTDGIRGRANQYPITPELCLKLGRVLAHLLRTQPVPGAPDLAGGVPRVVIGRDTRVSGPMLEAALVSGLLSHGVEVLQAGVLPTPVVAFLTRHHQCHAGIMLTASHNPFQDNGIKIFGHDGFKLDDYAEAQLEGLLQQSPEQLPRPCADQDVGSLVELAREGGDAAEPYLANCRELFTKLDLSGHHLVLDCANGAASQLGPRLFASFGASVTTIGDEPDGRNINEGCGSLHPEEAARLLAGSQPRATLGVCLDGDADRVIFIDERGQPVSGDRVLCLAALGQAEAGCLAHRTLVTTVMSNLGLRDTLARHGIKVETTGVGDRLVIQRMNEHGFTLGGENSGHLIFGPHSTTGDGLLSALHLLQLLQDSGRTLSQLAGEMTEYPQHLVNLAVRQKVPLDQLPELQQAIQEAESAFGQQGRTLIRYSGTENKMRIMVECADAELAQHHLDRLTQVAQECLGAG